jgi:uncharacterized membrane protein (UPF0127 family)
VQKYTALNRSQQTVLSTQCETADSGWARMKGLLGRSKEEFPPGRGLWLIPANSIHTIGMSFPIDVAYLDKAGRVIHIYRSLPPFRVAAIKLRARSVLELPAGTLARTRTEIGDTVEFQKPEDVESQAV